MENRQNLQRFAWVTGASEGIGRAFAKRLAKEGYGVIAVARTESRLQELMAELGSGAHSYRVADLSTPAGVQAIASELGRSHCDLLVNNAGFGRIGKFQDTDLAQTQQMMRLNIDALVTLSHAFVGQARKGDALVNVSSTLAFLPLPTNGVYSATKAFVTSFSEALWFEQKKRGVYVMNLCPGITATQFHARAGANEQGLPASLTQQPEEVVEAAMRALRSRTQPTIISGAKNRMGAWMSRLLSRKATVSMMGRMEA